MTTLSTAPASLAADNRPDTPLRFGFGRNWSDFVERSFSEERLNKAQRHLLHFLKLPDLRGRTFLDIGCGSGLHSLAAMRAGAERIISFDYDAHSVAATTKLRDFIGKPSHWSVQQGSVLDHAFMNSLPAADIVYSWGVLHHTGSMWEAIENASARVNEKGVFYIALYTTDVYTDPPPEYWLDIKRQYNRSSALGKKRMEWAYAWKYNIWPDLQKRRNPMKYLLKDNRERGMTYWTDVRDWLGGWPMEFAGIAETKAFAAERLDMHMLNIAAGEGNTEYLFRRNTGRNYFDDLLASVKTEPLAGPFRHLGGHCYIAEIPHLESSADSDDNRARSKIMLFEDGVPLGFPHQYPHHIKTCGSGRYSHWDVKLLFSTTDNTDPNTNARRYTIAPAFM